MNAGAVNNTASAAGTRPGGATVPSNPSSTSTPLTPAPALTVDKVAGTPIDVNGSGLTDAGDRIPYTFTVRNTGNVSVSGIAVTDARLADSTITCTPTTLGPDETAACTVAPGYQVTAADQTAGRVVNTATAAGTASGGGRVTSPADTTSTPVQTPDPRLVVDKVAQAPVDTNGSGITDVGDRITYSFTVRNTGNVPVTAVAVEDPKLTGSDLTTSCGTGALAPGQTRACTVSGPYAVTEADERAGEVANTATATGRDPDAGLVRSPADTTSTPTETPAPAITVVKSAGEPVDANGSGLTDAGDRIAYTFRVVNDGNVPLTAVTVADPRLAGQSVTVTCPPGPLAPGAGVTCTASGPYSVTGADEAAGEVANTATARGVPPRGQAVADSDTVTVPTTAPAPSLAVDKTPGTPVDANGSGITDAGDTIAYTFVVTNTGNVPVAGVAIDDPRLAGIPVACQPAGPLVPRDTRTCTTARPYVVTAADVAAGAVRNTATATGTDPDGDPVRSAADSADVPTTAPDPRLVVDKVAGAPVDVNGSRLTDAGDTIAYSFTVRNGGNVPVTGVAVDDSRLAGQGITTYCTPTRLVAGATATCATSAAYRVTSADEASGAATNTATARGADPDGQAMVSAPDETSTDVDTPVAQLDLVKSAGEPVDVNGSAITDAGDTVTFSFAVENTGNVPLRSVNIADPLLADRGITVACPDGTLPPGASVTCTAAAPYAVTRADEIAGAVANSARARAVDPDGDAVQSPQSSTSTPTTAPDPALTLDKSAGEPVDRNGSGLTDAGDTVVFTFTVTNSGNVPVSSIAIDDPPLAGLGLVCTPARVVPGGSAATCTTTSPYVVTAEDVAAGAVTNSARATGTDPDGDRVSSEPDATSTPTTAPTPVLELVKAAGEPVDTNASGITDAGDTVDFTFTVTNRGNVPVADVTVVDPLLAGSDIDVACTPTTLGPGDAAACTASAPHGVTEADEAVGSVTNRATALATDPDGGLVESAPDSTTTTVVVPRPGLVLEKDASTPVDVNGSGLTDAGDTIAYTFRVENTGNVRIRDVRVDDPLLAGAGGTITCTPTTLPAGGTATCTPAAPYVVTQVDEATGRVRNVATASGTDPDGDALAPSPPATTSTPTDAPAPALDVVKGIGRQGDVNGSGITDAGDTIVYSFTVRNTGNVPVSEVSIDDPRFPGQGIEVTCTPAVLAPGAGATCAQSEAYVVTVADQEAGSVLNTATATGTDPDGDPVVSPPDSASTPATAPAAQLDLQKSAGTPVDANGSRLVDAGDRVTYTFRVRNVGNVPVTAVRVADPKLAAAGVEVTCGPGPLGRDETRTCSSSPYTITTSDVGAGAVTNVATATATDPDGQEVESPTASTATPTTSPRPGLRVEKAAGTPDDVNGSGIVDAGDTIAYTFTVQNTGNVPVRAVSVEDPPLGGTLPCDDPTLAPGEFTSCGPVGYTVTEADERAGSVANSATGTGVDPDGRPVGSAPDTTSTPVVEPQPTLVVQKSAGDVVDVDGNGIDAGDTVDFSFTVRNSGNVPLTVLGVVDPLLPGPAGDGVNDCDPPVDLAPRQASPCVVLTHTITQAEVDAGRIVNTANGRGTDPDDDLVTSPPDTASVLLRQQPALELEKSVGDVVDTNVSGITDGGDTVEFTFTVTNVGNTTLEDITIDDQLVENVANIAVTCPAGLLVPQAATTCTAARPFTVRPVDVEAGAVSNTATASGTGPDGVVTSPPSSTATSTTRPRPRLDLAKRVTLVEDTNGSGITDAGDEITYAFDVQNVGNVPLTLLGVDDPMLTGAGIGVDCPAEPSPLPVEQVVVCTASEAYVVTAADEAAGAVDNAADATATDPDGGAVESPVDAVTTPVTAQAPVLVVTKSAGDPLDINGSGLVDVGDAIDYTFTVTNAGNVPVSSVTVVDPMLARAGVPVVCVPTALAPGAVADCATSTPYTVSAADVDAGSVDNTATATAVDPDGEATPLSNEASTSTPTTRPRPGLALVKRVGLLDDVNGSSLTDAGDEISYAFSVTNTGNVPVSAVRIDDGLLADRGIEITCDDTVVAPGASTECRTDPDDAYLVTGADEAAGSVDNTAAATGLDPDRGPVSSGPSRTSTPTTAPQSALRIEKTAGDPLDVNGSGIPDAGDTIEFTFVVVNDGNVPVTGLRVVDPLVGDVTCEATTLAPGASTDCAADEPYVVTGDDESAGSVVNAATARATDPDGDPVESPADATTTGTTAPDPALDLEKTAGDPADTNESGLVDAGDTIAFTFTVRNTGNVPLVGIEVDDPLAGSVTCEAVTLGVGEAARCTADEGYVVTAADESAGVVANVALARGLDPDGGDVESAPDRTSTPVDVQQPQLVVEKVAGDPDDVNGSGLVDAGDRILFTFEATNTGNVPVRALAIEDPRLDPVVVDCPAGPLGVGDIVTCTARAPYVVTEADERAGAAANEATAVAVDPDGDPVTSPPSTTSTPTTVPQPVLQLAKVAGTPVDVNDSGITDAGDTIAYSFTVTNTGNVPITAVAVDDDRLPGPVTCTPTTLRPGRQATCTAAPYMVTEADELAGSAANVATAIGTDPDGNRVESPEATTTTPTPQAVPSLVLEKRAAAPVDTDGNGQVDAGDTIAYTFAVTDTGNVPLSAVTVVDPLVGAVTCPSGRVGVDETVVCSAEPYRITQDDVDRGRIDNTAEATATDPDGEELTPVPDTLTVTTSTLLSLSLDKRAAAAVDANGTGRTDAGDTIAYTFTVTNTGSIGVDAVAVTDDRLSGVRCEQASLARGASTTCTAEPYVLTQADAEAGSVVNTATATALGAAGTVVAGQQVASQPDITSTTLPQVPALVLDKDAQLVDADADGLADAGEQVRYVFTVTNTGTVRISGVAVDDPMLQRAGDAITCPETSLEPGAVLRCTATYTVAAADVDAPLRNVAQVGGSSAQGPVTSPQDDATVTVDGSEAGDGAGTGDGDNDGGNGDGDGGNGDGGNGDGGNGDGGNGDGGNGDGDGGGGGGAEDGRGDRGSDGGGGGLLPDTGGVPLLLVLVGLAFLGGGASLVATGLRRGRREEDRR